MAKTTKTVIVRKEKRDGSVSESHTVTHSTTAGKVVKGAIIAAGALILLGALCDGSNKS